MEEEKALSPLSKQNASPKRRSSEEQEQPCAWSGLHSAHHLGDLPKASDPSEHWNLSIYHTSYDEQGWDQWYSWKWPAQTLTTISTRACASEQLKWWGKFSGTVYLKGICLYSPQCLYMLKCIDIWVISWFGVLKLFLKSKVKFS